MNEVVEAHREVFPRSRIEHALFAYGENWYTAVDLHGRPRPQSGANLLRKHLWVAGRCEHFLSNLSGGPMLPMAVSGSTDEDRCNHQRTRHAHHAHGIFEQPVMPPNFKRFLARFRKSEIRYCPPELLDIVITVGRQQFFGPYQAQRVPEIVRHHVLAALAAV